MHLCVNDVKTLKYFYVSIKYMAVYTFLTSGVNYYSVIIARNLRVLIQLRVCARERVCGGARACQHKTTNYRN